MIYFDTAYLLKCYVAEPNCHFVRQLFRQHQQVSSCEFAKIEFAAGIHRAVREGRLSEADVSVIQAQLQADASTGLLSWLPFNQSLVQSAQSAFLSLDRNVFLRSGDAIHLICACSHGFKEIHSNDQHLLRAAGHFGLLGVNVIP